MEKHGSTGFEFHYVGIGASSGGFETVEDFFSHMQEKVLFARLGIGDRALGLIDDLQKSLACQSVQRAFVHLCPLRKDPG